MKPLLILVFLLVIGLLIPASAQSAQRDPDYSQAVNTAKECKNAIDQNSSMTEAEKIVAKKKCARDSASKLYVDVEGKTTRLNELRIKNLVQCETWYDQYKIATEENSRF